MKIKMSSEDSVTPDPATAAVPSVATQVSPVSSFECGLAYVPCFILATIYVGSLYVWKDTKLPRLDLICILTYKLLKY